MNATAAHPETAEEGTPQPDEQQRVAQVLTAEYGLLAPPRYRLVFALVQTQGIVAVMCSAIAGVLGGLAGARVGLALAWPLGAVAFVVTLVALPAYWTQSIKQLQAAIRPMSPTPPDQEPRI